MTSEDVEDQKLSENKRRTVNETHRAKKKNQAKDRLDEDGIVFDRDALMDRATDDPSVNSAAEQEGLSDDSKLADKTRVTQGKKIAWTDLDRKPQTL